MDKNVGVIIYQQNTVQIDKLKSFKKKEGVWALLGRKQGEELFECLNVGKSVDVGKEIQIDLNYLDGELTVGEIDYINQYAESCGFKYSKNQTQAYLYPVIRQQFEELTFVLISDKSDRDIEKCFAWATHARYWRNGRPFQGQKEDYYNNNFKRVLGEKDIMKLDKLDNWINYVKNFSEF